MPARYKDYPVYSYDEPSIQSDFTGGINSDPSNEHLLANEMRDCLNMTYLSGALTKRKGAELVSRLICEEDLSNIQGIFLYTYKITYVIVAANGKLYFGLYNENVDINLTRLPIENSVFDTDLVFDPRDVLKGIDTYSTSIPEKHNGYIQKVYFNPSDNTEYYVANERGAWNDIEAGAIEPGDVVTETKGLITYRYMCIKEFEKQVITLDNAEYWEKQTTNYETAHAANWDSTTPYYAENTVVLDSNTGLYYICIKEHYNTIEVFSLDFIENYLQTAGHPLPQYFVNIDYKNYQEENQQNPWIEKSSFVFQNYRQIEGATLDNKLILATGTRICEVYPFDNSLKASVIKPYTINNSELINIGYNYLSPYPELNIASQKNTVSTQLFGVKVEKIAGGTYTLSPLVSVNQTDSLLNYRFKWEKLIGNTWYCIQTFLEGAGNPTLENVDDASEYYYRCTMASNFEKDELTDDIIEVDVPTISFDYSQLIEPTNSTYWERLSPLFFNPANTWLEGKVYTKDMYVKHENHFYICIIEHTSDDFDDDLEANKWKEVYSVDSLKAMSVPIWTEETEYSEDDIVFYGTYYYKCIEDHNSGKMLTVMGTKKDYVVNSVLEPENHTAVSTLFNDNLQIEDTFLTIHSCTKVIADGNKLLFYDDEYNSGMWFKTIISNPYYITDKGNLSFKTVKNEKVIKVVPFQGNLIIFANADNIGGSIHLVSGNGDDYNSGDGYYSPYQRKTINSSISCDNAKTIQVCDNMLFFKYFNRIYYISASDLNNDTVKVTPCNDRLLSKTKEVDIPWEDNDCISVVTNTYYGIIWKEKYYIDDNNDLILEHPGLRVKLYYNMLNSLKDNSYSMPWLRDESKYFNVDNILYVKGNPLYLYRNLLLNFNGDSYEDLDEPFDVYINFKGYDLEYPKLVKLLHNVLIYYQKEAQSTIDLTLLVKNEAGHTMISTEDNKKSSQELRVLFANKEKAGNTSLRLDSTIQDTKVINASYAFPCLLANASLRVSCKGLFSLSSLTFSYTTCETPDITLFDLYNKIIRPQDIGG